MTLAPRLPNTPASRGPTVGLVALRVCSLGPEELTPLERSVDSQNAPRVEEALKAGVDPNRAVLMRPLVIAAEHPSTDIVRMLIDAGASVNRSEGHGWTAIFAAARSGSLETVTLLLNAGAKVCHRTTVSSAKDLRPSEVARNPRRRGYEKVVRRRRRTVGLKDLGQLVSLDVRWRSS